MAPRKRGRVFIATQSFASGHQVVRKGDTVREGHPLLKGNESMFVPIDEKVTFEFVETATAVPGEKRQVQFTK